VKEYFIGMGISDCQIVGTQILASSTSGTGIDASYQRSVDCLRGIDGDIPIAESTALARINDEDRTNVETFFWPTLPASILILARAFKAETQDPTKLAAYKAKLPADAQGEGRVVIHHSTTWNMDPTKFVAFVSWDTVQGSTPVSFNTDGAPVPQGW
jgi:hypothetical protein